MMTKNDNKSGGYYFENYYPKDYEPPHVHLYSDDIKGKHGIRIGKDGKPLKGQPALSPKARRAVKNLLKKIIEELT